MANMDTVLTTEGVVLTKSSSALSSIHRACNDRCATLGFGAILILHMFCMETLIITGLVLIPQFIIIFNPGGGLKNRFPLHLSAA
jgi:hypothetical protein